MKRISVGTKLYLSVLSIFMVFAVAFIVFQHAREKKYKIDALNLKLQDYNTAMAETIRILGDTSEHTLASYVKNHPMQGLRVTLINLDGDVFFDNMFKHYDSIDNHLNRTEVRQAITLGRGYDINRQSTLTSHDYFYSATCFKRQGFVIRTALPYDNTLSQSLEADQHYIWFTLAVVFILTLVLYRFISRLGANITKLSIFATRADRGESLDSEDLVAFPSDELGEIAERIIKIYKRLKRTREEQNVLKRQLTQNIAHELKTPVASIQGYLETILDNDSIAPATKKQFMKRCYAQAQRLTSLLHDISTLNRLDDASELMTNFDLVDINNIVAGIEQETALQLAGQQMAFSNQLPSGIVIHGNLSLVYSVFRNLTDNAIAYAGCGTTITLKASDEGNHWHFTFADNGVGVPYEHLSRIFERFYRVDKGRSRKMGGTGLGLAIVKNSVLLHGGNISVRNNPEGGLRFDFSMNK